MSHTKNKTKFWRKMGNKIAHIVEEPVNITDADGNVKTEVVKIRKVLTGRQLKYVNLTGIQAKGEASNLMKNLMKKGGYVNMSIQDVFIPASEGEVNEAE